MSSVRFVMSEGSKRKGAKAREGAKRISVTSVSSW
jgi:hypothetical protein